MRGEKNKFVFEKKSISFALFVCVLFRAIKRSNCFHKSGGKDPCHMSSNGYMITFGIIEVLFSQIPDFDQVWWLSIVAAIMSFTYSSVGLGLGLGKVAGIYKLIFCSKLCRYMRVTLGPIISYVIYLLN